MRVHFLGSDRLPKKIPEWPLDPPQMGGPLSLRITSNPKGNSHENTLQYQARDHLPPIEGMTCASCVDRVEHALKGFTGVAEARVRRPPAHI